MYINLDAICNFFDSNFFQTIFLTAVGALGWFIYKRQVTDEIKKAAKIIKLEIDSIEEALNKLKIIKIDPEEIYKTAPLYFDIEWYKVRNLFTKKLSIDSINAINKFYEMTIICEDARQKVKETIHLNRIDKINATQAEIAKILSEYINEEALDSVNAKIKVDKYKELYDNISQDFFPRSVENHMTKSLSLIYNISNTPAYEELKSIVYKKK